MPKSEKSVEKSSDNNNNGNELTNKICHNYLRGCCWRKNCRYSHVSADSVVFCHDYQNSVCIRKVCKFLHCTVQEEKYFKSFGQLPNGNDFSSPSSVQDNERQFYTQRNVCKDFILNGVCRHRDCFLFYNKNLPTDGDLLTFNDFRRNGRFLDDDCIVGGGIKRSQFEAFGLQLKRLRTTNNNKHDNDNNDSLDRNDILAVIRRFDEEQTMLRRRVESNELKIAELRANNEYLMAQNAQLRLSNQVVQQQQQSQSQQQQPPTPLRCSVTQAVTQTTQQTQPPQVMTAVSIAPVQVQATPIVSIATPETQIIATNSGTPLAITAANTSQGPQLAISQQNIASISNGNQPAILGASQITLSPARLTINTSQALAISNATQPIISYPIMTHSILPH